MIAYADSSALVKLVLREPESPQLLRRLQTFEAVVTSELAVVEVTRAARRVAGTAGADLAESVLTSVAVLAVDRAVLRRAAALPPDVLRSLDAIHLSSALEIGEDVIVVAYDRRLLDAASALGLAVDVPT